jgi:hypothetical protein
LYFDASPYYEYQLRQIRNEWWKNDWIGVMEERLNKVERNKI